MDILVCFKIVPDLDMLSGGDWIIYNNFQVNTSFARKTINPYDESALELVLKLNEDAIENNLDLKLTALTIGENGSKRILKNLYALKYDHVVMVKCDFDIRFNSMVVSRMIYQYINNIRKQQVIILGNQSNEGDNAKTPLLLAERLGVPCVNSVINIKLSEQDGCLDITSIIDNLMIEQTIKPPVVLVIGNVPNSYIRVPTLKDKMRYSKKEIEVYTLKDLNIKENKIEEKNDCQLINLFYEKNEKSCRFIQEQNPSENANVLYEAYLKERLKI